MRPRETPSFDICSKVIVHRTVKETIQSRCSIVKRSWMRLVFDDVKLPLGRRRFKNGAGYSGECRPICREQSKNWKAREGGRKDREHWWIPFRSFYRRHFSRRTIAFAWFHSSVSDRHACMYNILESRKRNGIPRQEVSRWVSGGNSCEQMFRETSCFIDDDSIGGTLENWIRRWTMNRLFSKWQLR